MKIRLNILLLLTLCFWSDSATAEFPFDLSNLDSSVREAVEKAQHKDNDADLWSQAYVACLSNALRIAQSAGSNHVNNVVGVKNGEKETYLKLGQYCWRAEIIHTPYDKSSYKTNGFYQWRNLAFYLNSEYGEDSYLLIKREEMQALDVLPIWETYARKGDPVAMYYLALEHNIRQQYALALRWMHSAAEAGLLRAQLSLFEWYSEFDQQGNEIHAPRAKKKLNESYKWLLRAGSQQPNVAFQGMTLLNLDSLVAKSRKELFELHRKQNRIEESRQWEATCLNDESRKPLDKSIYKEAYKISCYLFNTTTNDLMAQNAFLSMELYAYFLPPDELEEAKNNARNFSPRMELNPAMPFANDKHMQFVTYGEGKQEILQQQRVDAQPTPVKADEASGAMEIERDRLELEKVKLQEQNHQASEQLLLQERSLAEQERANRAREQQEKNRQTIDGMKTLTDQLNRQYPVYDPLAPGTRNNPYVIESK